MGTPSTLDHSVYNKPLGTGEERAHWWEGQGRVLGPGPGPDMSKVTFRVMGCWAWVGTEVECQPSPPVLYPRVLQWALIFYCSAPVSVNGEPSPRGFMPHQRSQQWLPWQGCRQPLARHACLIYLTFWGGALFWPPWSATKVGGSGSGTRSGPGSPTFGFTLLVRPACWHKARHPHIPIRPQLWLRPWPR